MTQKPSVWKRAFFHIFIVLPFFIPMLVIVEDAIFKFNWVVSWWVYLILIFISIIAYVLLEENEKEIYSDGDLPAYNSMFFAALLMIPLVVAFSPSSNAIQIFTLMDGAIVVATSIFVILLSTLKKADLPKTDSVAGFLLVIVGTITLTIVAMGLFAFGQHILFAFLLNLLTIYLLFALSIYMIQIYSRKEKINLRKLLLNGN